MPALIEGECAVGDARRQGLHHVGRGNLVIFAAAQPCRAGDLVEPVPAIMLRARRQLRRTALGPARFVFIGRQIGLLESADSGRPAFFFHRPTDLPT